ncbi:hypothetical protein [Luteipulveratus mongoliensis]|nr:hypothetical protein [Luteipulveratus mongoliensis]
MNENFELAMQELETLEAPVASPQVGWPTAILTISIIVSVAT